MRPELELIERIEKYLSGELSSNEKTSFELQLADDPSLREAVQLQRDIQGGLERASLGESIRRARQHFYRGKWFRWSGGFGLLTVIVIVTFLLMSSGSGFTIIPGTTADTHGETYTIDLRRDTTLHTAQGAIIHIAPGSIDAGGASNVKLEIKEAYSIAAMLRYGLLTQSDGRPLSSGGMIDIQPAEGSQARIIHPIAVSLPTTRIQENMQRFKGFPDDKGKINWVDPTSLADSTNWKEIAHGKALFETTCSQCHSINATVTGPALAYIGQRRSRDWLFSFIRNNRNALASGDCYANYIFNVYAKTPMNLFPNLTDSNIDQILAYISNQSQLIDSNSVPNYTRELDSCLRYKRLAGALEKNREALILANGERTKVIRRDDSGTLITDTAIVYTNPAPVVTVSHPSIYYSFTVESFGWYNVDALLKDIPGIQSSELRVQMTSTYAAEVNVFLVLPGRKIFTDGGLLKNSKTDFGFFTEDGQIPMPQREQAYVFATGEYQGKPVFAIKGFMTALRQNISLQPEPMTKEQIAATIGHLDLNQLSIRVANAPNAARIRAIDTALAKIAPFKPQHCDCDCAPKADSPQ